ncbi:LysM peptidoglycan-binding domain-containing protein [Streptomyces sp. NBC_01356]|uniref:LysM peptidoglycan-binding domain-containing protein n=1 Tax=Streptomyces sp. NBC_01356 TaxID=2903836 RepID=UPI002E2FE4CA|nr:transglycosylase family protein [Streptomyces sp. NBC_01356]
MLSGNGRHRRPRQAPALIVAAGVTGSAIAIPLLGATSASAADATTWDRVAECETGASWSDNTGDGYYGGLHLTQWDWENYGGIEYAPSADQASRSQQIAVAEKILDGRGVVAWPTCGPLSGLGKDSASADVDTGVSDDSSSDTSTSDSSGSSESTDSSGSLDLSASSSPSPSASSSSDTSTKSDTSDAGEDADSSATNDDDSDKSPQSDDSSDASDGATTGAGRHRGDTATEGTTDGRTDSTAGRHASRDSDGLRGVVDGSYIVRVGDSLSAIADALGLEGGWAELYAENVATVGTDANLILPGQSLAVGAEPGEK